MKPISDKTRPIDLTGKFSPFMPSPRMGVPDQPAYLSLHDAPGQFWCVVFSNVEALHACMAFCGIKGYKIKHIDDGREFAQSVLETGMVRLMLDPYIVNNEKTRWTEVVLDDGGDTKV